MTVPQLVDRLALKRSRTRAAHTLQSADYLKQEMACIIRDRLADLTRSFHRGLDLGAHTGWPIAPLMATTHISCDISEAMVRQAQGMRIVASEEALPFAPHAFDLIISAGSLHWVNDLPGTLVQCLRCLEPGGFFIASFLGAPTLEELHTSLIHGDATVLGGARRHIVPMIDVREAGQLMVRAGFAMPVAEIDKLTVLYEDPFILLSDLRAMGERNVLWGRSFLRRDVLQAAHAYYHQTYGTTDGRIPASFSILTMSGWAPE